MIPLLIERRMMKLHLERREIVLMLWKRAIMIDVNNLLPRTAVVAITMTRKDTFLEEEEILSEIDVWPLDIINVIV
jgi:hypothetical protein